MIPIPTLPADLRLLSEFELQGAVLAFLAIGDKHQLERVQAEKLRRQQQEQQPQTSSES